MFDPDQTKLKNCIRYLDSMIPANDVGNNYFKPPEDSAGESSSDEREGKVKRNKTPNTPNTGDANANKNVSKLPSNNRSNVVSMQSNIPKKDRNERKRNSSLGPEKKSARLLTSDNNDKNLKKKK